METKSILFTISLISFIFSNEVGSQVCTRMVSYQTNYTMLGTNKVTTKWALKTIEQCCYGFIEKKNSCVPHCPMGCEHGQCISPGNCVCNDGWKKNSAGQCELNCKLNCNDSTCSASDDCKSKGYKLVNETRTPKDILENDTIAQNATVKEHSKYESEFEAPDWITICLLVLFPVMILVMLSLCVNIYRKGIFKCKQRNYYEEDDVIYYTID